MSFFIRKELKNFEGCTNLENIALSKYFKWKYSANFGQPINLRPSYIMKYALYQLLNNWNILGNM